MNAVSMLNPTWAAAWDPFRDLNTFENRLEKFLGWPLITGNGGDKEYIVKAELPELKKEDVKVTVENGELTISGECKFEKEEKGKPKAIEATVQ